MRSNTSATGFFTDLAHDRGANIGPADRELNGTYAERVFAQHVVGQIQAHFTASSEPAPMYIYLSHQVPHTANEPKRAGPQAPLETVARYDDKLVADVDKVMAACVTELDWAVGNVTNALRAAFAFSNTVVLFTTDNGGHLHYSSNAPFRGGKHGRWEGGVRGVGFVYSELLPASRRGTEWPGLVHAVDIYSTIIEGMAGVSMPEDTGPLSLDGMNVWPALRTGAASPRTAVVVQAMPQDEKDSGDHQPKDMCEVLIVGDLKLVVGFPGDSRTGPATLPAPAGTTPFGLSGGTSVGGITEHCGAPRRNIPLTADNVDCGTLGCLFDVAADLGETTDLSTYPEYAARLAAMQQQLAAASFDAWPSDRTYAYGQNSATQRLLTTAVRRLADETGYRVPADIFTEWIEPPTSAPTVLQTTPSRSPTNSPTREGTPSCPIGYFYTEGRARWTLASQYTEDIAACAAWCATVEGCASFRFRFRNGMCQLHTANAALAADMLEILEPDVCNAIVTDDPRICCEAAPVTPAPVGPPTRFDYCPEGYGDYGSRYNFGLGRVTITTSHEQCAERCQLFSAPQFAGGCKAFMTGMYFGMLFCRSYGGNLRTTNCAAWAVPSNRGMNSGEIGSFNTRTGQVNIGGHCCSNTTVVQKSIDALNDDDDG